MSKHPINILERYWKFTAFRGNQEAIINSVLNNEDVFALMPTGGGKSICFQIPALIKDGICIVVSPLIALMKDQVKNLNNRGIKALSITSGMSKLAVDTILDNCIYGNYKFLYVSPERLQQPIVKDRIRQMHVNLIAVDEAHCISQWGNDFRPSYANLLELRKLQPSVNIIALTATAKPNVVEDIIHQLDFINPKIYKQTFYRDNLGYIVLHKEDKYHTLISILKKHKGASIIYARSRRVTLEINTLLNTKHITSTYYHGGLSMAEKDNNMGLWMADKKQVMVATNAFGMGIDKADVKTVIHINLPESMESYFQEAGRAGRNGKNAYAVILKNNYDEVLVKKQFLNNLPTVNDVKLIYRKLCSYFQISYGEGMQMSFDFDFSHFCNIYNFNNNLCYYTLQLLDKNSIISLSNRFKNKTLVKFIVSNNAIFSYLEKHPNYEIIVKSLLRSYGGIFDFEVDINIKNVAQKAAVTENYLTQVLKQLEKNAVINLKVSRTDAQITFIEPREDELTINRIASTIKDQNALKKQNINAVITYINNTETCRSKQLLHYFGDNTAKLCGICSVCTARKKNNFKLDKNILRKKVIKLLETGDKSSREILSVLNCNETDLKETLKTLLEHKILKITPKNTYKLKHL